jgi:8-oxo-dGTP diphosphatase
MSVDETYNKILRWPKMMSSDLRTIFGRATSLHPLNRKFTRENLTMPEATVAAILTSVRDGSPHVLLTRRAQGLSFAGYWCLPGGHIERYEKARDAAIREAKEETGLDFDAQFFGCFDEIIPEREIHAVVCVYTGEGQGELVVPPEEVSEIQWFPLQAALTLQLAFDHHAILAAYPSSGAGVSERS